MVSTRCKALGPLQTISASVAVTVTWPDLTDFLLIHPVGHDLSITYDGTTPTTDLGFIIKKDQTNEVYVGPEMLIKITAKSGDPIINIQPFRKLADVNT